MRTRYILFIALIIGSASVFAQQNNIWYFGGNAGLDFNTGSPVALTNSAMNTSEGCTSISDASGNLLFYTDGVKVWNKNHVVMPNGNGLNGESISAQSGIIVPMPGNPNIYYLFTQRNWSTSGIGAFYNTIDMTLNGGLGDVVSKNQFLHSSTRESITAVKHCNSQDYWITLFDINAQRFYSYLLTSSGLQASTPSISNVGSFLDAPNRFGVLKFSPQGDKLAYVLGHGNSDPAHLAYTTLEVYDFNAGTGIISNPKTIEIGNYWTLYSCEFSPNGRILYACGYNNSYLNQYDLTAGSGIQIQASKVVISNAGVIATCLQLGPDQKIYVAHNGKTYMGAIQSPNTLGVGCNYIENVVSLSGRQGRLGLPNFIPSVFNIPQNVYMSVCENDEAYPNHDTIYVDTLQNVNGCDSIINLHLTVLPSYETTQNLSICAGTTITLPGGSSADSSGIYTDTLNTMGGCDSIITINLVVLPNALSSQTISVCLGDSALLPGGSYGGAGTYSDTLVSANGCDSIIITTVSVLPYLTGTQTLSICEGRSITLPDGSIVTDAGTYTDTIPSISGCDSIITYNVSVLPYLTGTQNLSVCEGGSITLPDGTIFNGSGTHTDTIPSVSGCDSIVTYTINVIPAGITTVSVVLNCNNDTYTLPNGDVVSTGGSYIDTLKTAGGCDSIVVVNVSVTPNPVANFTADVVSGFAPLLVQFTNQSLYANQYTWEFGDGSSSNAVNPSHIFEGSGTYVVTLTASLDSICFDTATMVIVVLDNFSIFIPDVFTPNEDQLNDVFMVKAEGVKQIEVEIYDRWGLKLYGWDHPAEYWDGRTFSGNKSPDGTYYYVINLVDVSGQDHKYAGYFSLLK
jgi:gliding motility-associated-like protein